MARQTNLGVTRNDWADFARWCVARGEVAMPATPASVVEYIEGLAAGDQRASVLRRVNVIGDWHRASGLTSPTDDDRVRVAVTRAQWQQRKVPGHTIPLDATELATILGALPGGLVGARDRALLLVGYVAGLRPSELVSLDVSDLVVVDQGLAISLMRGRIVIPYGTEPDLCPVLAWREWLAEAGLTAGPAFRSVDRTGRLGLTRLGEKAITRMVQRAAERAGLDESRYSALSLRLGMLASKAPAGTPGWR
jgi:site-specific recombinase XerD